MKIGVIGLGSMGKRRIRNLQHLKIYSIIGYDISESRRRETSELYGVKSESSEESFFKNKFDAIIISTPPQHHMYYAEHAAELAIPSFVEASVVEAERIAALDKFNSISGNITIPSCTMVFFPFVSEIKRIVDSRVLGDVLTINYQVGQYLVDWHPWEDIKEYYVSIKETGGARELVPFELTWMVQVFGSVKVLGSTIKKLSEMEVEIDDTYLMQLQFGEKSLCNMLVEVISRPKATREMYLTCSNGILKYSANKQIIEYILVGEEAWTEVPINKGKNAPMYINPEEPYISEMSAFIDVVKNRNLSLFPNSLSKDYKILEVLKAIEEEKN